MLCEEFSIDEVGVATVADDVSLAAAASLNTAAVSVARLTAVATHTSRQPTASRAPVFFMHAPVHHSSAWMTLRIQRSQAFYRVM